MPHAQLGSPKGRQQRPSKASQKHISEAPKADDTVSLPSADAENPEELQAAEGLQPATTSSAASGAPPRTAVETKAGRKAAAKQKAAVSKSRAARAAAKPKAGAKRKAPGWLPLPDGIREKIGKLKNHSCKTFPTKIALGPGFGF